MGRFVTVVFVEGAALWALGDFSGDFFDITKKAVLACEQLFFADFDFHIASSIMLKRPDPQDHSEGHG